MDITISQEQGRVPVTVFRIRGNVDASTAGEFERKVREATAAGTRHLLLDMQDTPFISSAGLRAIHAAFIELRNLTPDMPDKDMRDGINAGTYKSPQLKLLSPSTNVSTALHTAGFDMYLESHTDLKKAVASF
jgi:anti-anti-sigma factor